MTGPNPFNVEIGPGSDARCWNGHTFLTAMGQGVRGIQTVCPECGAGIEGNEDARRLRLVHFAPELLIPMFQTGASVAVVENALPTDAKLVAVRPINHRDPPNVIVLEVHSSEFSPVNPLGEIPDHPTTTFRNVARPTRIGWGNG